MDLETTTLIEPDFPIGLFSDLHSDLDSLNGLLAKEPKVKRWFCLGDYIDFRAFEKENTETLKKCQDLSILGVRGNHDNYAMALDGKVSPAGVDFLMSLPDALVLECPFGRIGCFHATPDSENAFCGPDEMAGFLPTFRLLGLTHVFVGHTHKSYAIEAGGIRIFNLGHLAGTVAGEAKQTYAMMGADGAVQFKTLEAHPGNEQVSGGCDQKGCHAR